MLQSDGAENDPHNAIADALNAWRGKPEVVAQVEARRRPQFDAPAEAVMRVGAVRALAMALVELVEEEEDPWRRDVLALDFAEAVESSRILVRLRRERDAKGSGDGGL